MDTNKKKNFNSIRFGLLHKKFTAEVRPSVLLYFFSLSETFHVRKLAMIFPHVFPPVHLFSCFILLRLVTFLSFSRADGDKCVAISHCMKATLSGFS